MKNKVLKIFFNKKLINFYYKTYKNSLQGII